MVITSISIAPGAENMELLAEQDMDYKFTYDIVKGAPSVSDPVSFKYRALLSTTANIDDVGNRQLLPEEQTHTVNSDHVVECKINPLYL